MRNMYLPENGFREIWLQDVEPTFRKDGDIIESAVYNLQPWWARSRGAALAYWLPA